jgi:hypothetical protein
MSVTLYDPEAPMAAGDWLALAETERLRLAQNYHVQSKIKAPRMKAHAAVHVIVENQIATGYGPTRRAVERLVAGGLTRHEAIHAVGTVVVRAAHQLTASSDPEFHDTHQKRMGAAIDSLTVESWKALGLA